VDIKRQTLFKTKILNIIDEIKEDLDAKISKFDHKSLKISKKIDDTIVTDMDIYISELFKDKITKLDTNINFFSEEHPDKFEFPVAILDPIDGTKEFAKGLDECAVSFGIYFSENLNDERNFSWIYNFYNKFEIHSEQIDQLRSEFKGKLKGMVSNTEYNKGLYTETEYIKPMGSIAYKLGLLADGQCDFVITKRPKNIWDIAAGTHLCLQRDIQFYSDDITEFKITDQLYKPNMIWAKSSNIDFINEIK
jgi:myo-inositol-1(or 4)-monophosphatase